jgi:ribosomal-protein-alanine N-acetyltransferase
MNDKKIDPSLVHMTLATIDDYPILQNMGRYYVYDMSEYLGETPGWEIPSDGLYECIDFIKYWQSPQSFPYLIHYANELAGFVIVDRVGTEAAIDYNMAQFFVLRKFKHKGLGRYIAFQCFDRYPGLWEIMIIPGNEGAYHFWKRIIGQYTQEKYQEYERKVAHFNNATKNIFCFNTRTNKIIS